MESWTLWTSGLCTARLYVDGANVQAECLDPATAAFSPRRPMTQAVADLLGRSCGFDLPTLFAALYASGGGLLSGSRYTTEDGRWYIERDVKWPNNALVEDGKVLAFVRPNRERVHVLCRAGYEDRTVLAQWAAYRPGEVLHPIRVMTDLAVPMRDGVTLSTTVLLPADLTAPLPAILVRSPYGKEGDVPMYERYAHRGYAVVVQDTRGRNKSGGVFIPEHDETEDGDDTLNWIAAQPWSDGGVGMIGGSYLGYVQWAAAASGNPHLKALVSVVAAGSAFVDLPRKGGGMSSGSLAWNFGVSGPDWAPELMERDDWDEVLEMRPLEDIPRRVLGKDIPFYSEYFKHMDCDAFWDKGNWYKRGRGVVNVPALIVSGWFDDNGMGTTEALDLTKDYPAGRRKVLLGPWQHSGNSRYDLHGLHFGNSALRFDVDLLFLQWFDHWLKGLDNGAEDLPPVQYYTMGAEAWRTAQDWPPPQAKPCALYPAQDGTLGFEAPEAGAVSYDYDPGDPARHLIDLSENELAVPEDYAEEEKRPDVLTFTTPALEAPVTFTGDFTAHLFVSSDCPDTDFVVRICDVDPSGRSMRMAGGVLSARHRNVFEKSQWMEPGEVYELVIRTTKVSHCFLPGHAIRVSITSGCKNLLFPNSNTKAGFNSAVTRVAHNTVHLGRTRIEGFREP